MPELAQAPLANDCRDWLLFGARPNLLICDEVTPLDTCRILRRHLLSKASILLSCVVFRCHVSLPYVRVDNKLLL